jgi:hypothetical protein
MSLYAPGSCGQINLRNSQSRLGGGGGLVVLTSSSVQSATTSLAFEVLSFLMRDENLQVIEITLTFDLSANDSREMGD